MTSETKTRYTEKFKGRELFELVLREKHPDFIITKITGVLIDNKDGWVQCVFHTGDEKFDWYAFPTHAIMSIRATGVFV